MIRLIYTAPFKFIVVMDWRPVKKEFSYGMICKEVRIDATAWERLRDIEHKYSIEYVQK
jgi:hypothetical protein